MSLTMHEYDPKWCDGHYCPKDCEDGHCPYVDEAMEYIMEVEGEADEEV